jgi:hypothetical protein
MERKTLTEGVREAILEAAIKLQEEPAMIPTLRDYFAAQALTGLLAEHLTADALQHPNEVLARGAAELSYMIADAMIAAREKKAEAA